MGEPPLVSVGVPTCNRAPFLERALESLVSQDYPNLEIIVSDNASTDDTRDVCARFQESHPSVRYERCPTRIHVLENFRRALLLARGRYFMWASDDDLWAPGFVSTLADRLEANPELTLAAAEAQYMLADGTRLPFFAEGQAFYHAVRPRWRRLLRLVGHNYGNLFYGLFRRDALVAGAGGTVLDGCRSVNEIPVLIPVAWRGGIVVCPDVLFFKTARLSTYLQAAREYRVTPIPTATVARSRGRAWSAMARVIAYHAVTLEDVRRALWRLDTGWTARLILWGIFSVSLAGHLLKIAVVWPSQDTFRHVGRVIRRVRRPPGPAAPEP